MVDLGTLGWTAASFYITSTTANPLLAGGAAGVVTFQVFGLQ